MQRILIRYKDYDSHVRLKTYMGLDGKPAQLVGSMLLTKEEFENVKKILDAGAKMYKDIELEFQETTEFTTDPSRIKTE